MASLPIQNGQVIGHYESSSKSALEQWALYFEHGTSGCNAAGVMVHGVHPRFCSCPDLAHLSPHLLLYLGLANPSPVLLR